VLRTLNPTAAASFETYRKPTGGWMPPQGRQKPPGTPPAGSFA
jgi:hypothetical protein